MKLSKEVNKVISAYPDEAKKKIIYIVDLIFETADEINAGKITESIKWGEPSFCVKNGTPIRTAWKSKTENEIGVYFSCSTSLIETFRVIYNDQFRFEGKRGIIFNLEEKIPETELKNCFAVALKYHKVKNLPLLGM